MFFSRRKRVGPDLHLDWKVRIFFAGALIAFIGMILNSSLLVVVAIAVLLVGVFLRFLPGLGRGTRQKDEEDSLEAED
jgi:Flp pilus assembly protein TadB